ncbi:MAG: SOS response-associated peptidase, partial [Methanomicrobiales archaeon]|nr:SOS response-associated peptidase [Methanomicrobiales archaeon]
MCGRFTIAISVGFYDRFQVRKELSPPIGSHFNITPDQEIPVICRGNGLYHNLTLMRWGLVPSWTSDPIHGRHPINARKESLLEKPMFKNLISM